MPADGDMHRLPGFDLVSGGIEDALAGRDTPSAALVQMARPRLRRLGLDVPASRRDEPAAHHLYDLLVAADPGGAHSRYNALVGRVASFARAAEHARAS